MYMTRVMIRRIPPPNIIHGILSAAFPGERNPQVNETLWRIDTIDDAKALIVVSASTPNALVIANQMGMRIQAMDSKTDTMLTKTVDYLPFLKSISNGQAWHFRLCANPVEHKRQNLLEKRGKVYALRSVEGQLEWLGRQGERNGFAVSDSFIAGDTWIAFRGIRIRAVTFDGHLKVVDAEAFRSALVHGIGRGKAYGCGLLTVAKAI